MRVSNAVRWSGLALLGILVAVAVAIAASRLASQQIGLASEPISAGDALAPARQQHRAAPGPSPTSGGHRRRGHRNPTQGNPPASVPTQPATPVTPAPISPVEQAEPGQTGGDGEQGGNGADD